VDPESIRPAYRQLEHSNSTERLGKFEKAGAKRPSTSSGQAPGERLYQFGGDRHGRRSNSQPQ